MDGMMIEAILQASGCGILGLMMATILTPGFCGVYQWLERQFED